MRAIVIVAVCLAVILFITFCGGCAVTRIEGECVYVRELTTTYTCEKDGKAEAIRIQPPD